MQVKCQTCGATQSSEVESNCKFCGVQLDNNFKISENDLNQFTLALYEFNNSNFPKALLLFEEIIKIHQNNPVAWIYKVNCELRLNMPTSENSKEFEQSTKWLFEKFGNNPNVQYLIENTILETIEFLFKLRIKRPIPKINHNNVEGFLEYNHFLSFPNKEFTFLSVINRLSFLFSSRFSFDFLRLLSEYIYNLENNNNHNQKRSSYLLLFPFIIFNLTALFNKSEINLTDYFLKILKSLEYSTDDSISTTNRLVYSWSNILKSLSNSYFTESELQEIHKLDINYKKIEQYLVSLKKEEIATPYIEKEQKKESKKGCFNFTVLYFILLIVLLIVLWHFDWSF